MEIKKNKLYMIRFNSESFHHFEEGELVTLALKTDPDTDGFYQGLGPYPGDNGRVMFNGTNCWAVTPRELIEIGEI